MFFLLCFAPCAGYGSCYDPSILLDNSIVVFLLSCFCSCSKQGGCSDPSILLLILCMKIPLLFSCSPASTLAQNRVGAVSKSILCCLSSCAGYDGCCVLLVVLFLLCRTFVSCFSFCEGYRFSLKIQSLNCNIRHDSFCVCVPPDAFF